MKAVVLVASLLALSYADMEEEMVSMDKRAYRKHYCGRNLRRILMFLCDSTYKRSSPGDGNNNEGWVMNFINIKDQQSSGYQYPFRSRARALSIIPEYFLRQTRGVADECCSKPCTIDELTTYCGSNPSLTTTTFL